MKKINTFKDLIKHLLYKDNNRICTRIRGDGDISDILSPTIKKRILKIIDDKNE